MPPHAFTSRTELESSPHLAAVSGDPVAGDLLQADLEVLLGRFAKRPRFGELTLKFQATERLGVTEV